MWTLSEPDDNDSRVLHSDTNNVNVNLLPTDQVAARDAGTRAAMQAVLMAAIRQSGVVTVPSFSYDDLDRLRASLDGAPFQPPPKFKLAGS